MSKIKQIRVNVGGTLYDIQVPDGSIGIDQLTEEVGNKVENLPGDTASAIEELSDRVDNLKLSKYEVSQGKLKLKLG